MCNLHNCAYSLFFFFLVRETIWRLGMFKQAIQGFPHLKSCFIQIIYLQKKSYIKYKRAAFDDHIQHLSNTL